MTDRDKVQKAFNQCSDALSNLDQQSIMKVFHLLSVHFDVVAPDSNVNNGDNHDNPPVMLPEQKKESQAQIKVSDPKKTASGKKPKSTSKGQNYLIDYNFRPSGVESLQDFVGKIKVTSNLERNLAFIYYLQEIIKENPITIDHVYSCYRHLNLKLPLLSQSLFDTKSLKGWIETSNIHDLKVVREGINYFEHDIMKRGAK